MKVPANQGGLSIFVVGRAGSEYGLPVAVIYDQPRNTLQICGEFLSLLWAGQDQNKICPWQLLQNFYFEGIFLNVTDQ